MKKLFSFCMALIATLSLWAGNTITYTAAEKLTETTDTYSSGLHTNAFNVSITSHTFSNGTGTITFSGEVASIGDYAFFGCSGLTSVTIPNSVTSIGRDAFYRCSGLTSITIPNSVASIGNEAFYNCSSLTSVTVGSSVTSIGSYAFFGCSGLVSVYITNLAAWCGIEFGYFSSNPLYYAKHLCLNGIEVNDLIIPDSVTSIGEYAFSGCSGLTSITIGNSVTSIASSAFSDCSGITSIVWNTKNYSDPSRYEYAPFYHISSQITQFSFGDNVEYVPSYLCYNMMQLTSVTIPSSVASIGNDAFDNCSGLTSVYITNLAAWCGIEFGNLFSNPLYNAKHLYLNDSEITKLVIPYAVTSIGDYAFENCSSLTSVTIPNSVVSIGHSAFYGCTSLTSVYITDLAAWCKIDFAYCFSNPLYYAQHLFLNNSELTKLDIPYAVTSIGDYAFENCNSLTSVTIPNSVTSIGDETFLGCSNLPIENGIRYADTYLVEAVDRTEDSYAIKEGTKWIGSHAFFNCSDLIAITIPNSVMSIGAYAFCRCSNLKSITLPNSITNIGDAAFADCSGLTSITIPNSVTSIEGSAFYHCYELTSITIPNSVKSIGDWAFFYCYSLTSITIPNSVKCIGEYAFHSCSGLTSAIIGNSVTSIGDWAFYDCKNLKDIYNCSSLWITKGSEGNGYVAYYADKVYSGVELVGDYVFKNGNILIKYWGNRVDVVIPDYVTSIGSSAFKDCSNVASVTIPNSVKSIGEYAFYGCKRLVTITCFATNPPTAYGNSFQYYDCDLYVPCDELRTYKRDEVFGQFENIECIGAESGETVTDVVTTPSDNTVTILWPKDDAASTYTIVITKDGATICTLTFNAAGQLMNIAFAPGRDTEMPSHAAESINGSWSFTVTGLNSGTKYEYSVTTKNSAQSVLSSYSGSFTTTGTTSLINTSIEMQATKFFRDGQLHIIRDGKTYTAQGVMVE